MIYGRVMSIFLLFTGCEISEQTPPFAVTDTPLPLRFEAERERERGCAWRGVIGSYSRKKRGHSFPRSATCIMPTSQLETTLSLLLPPTFDRILSRDPLPSPPRAPFPYCLRDQHHQRCHCIEKYHAPINHLQHRILYQRTIRER